MFLVSYSLIAMSSVTFVLGLVYFYIFLQDHYSYMKFWGLSWLIYSLSFTLDFLKSDGLNTSIYIITKQGSYLLISLLFLFGSYDFFKQSVPKFWLYFSIVNIACLVGAAFSLPLFLPLTLHSAIFLCFISIWNGLLFIFHSWQIKIYEKYLIGFIFIIWGIYKGYYPFIHPDFWLTSWSYLVGTILINILSILILLIYFKKNKIYLTQREKLFRLLAENASDLIYLYKFLPNPKFDYISPAVIYLMDYTPEDIYNNPEVFFHQVHPDDQSILKEAFNNPNKASEKSITLRWFRKNGLLMWGELHNTIIFNEVGKAIAIEGILRDITQRKEVEENLFIVEKSRHELITNISHELRTPITLIQGYIEAILDGIITNSDDLKVYLKLIHNKASGLSRLINDLFQLTQLECRKIDFQFYQFPISKLIQQIYNKYEFDVRDLGINFELKNKSQGFQISSDENLIVTVDADRIEQVLSNLIFNAVKHTPFGGTIMIYYAVLPYSGASQSVDDDSIHLLPNQEIIISVQDNGCGISSEDLPYIFDRLYKGNTSQFSKGRGLGLSIAKEIVEYHGGRIWAENAPIQGSIFSFTLPIFL